MPARSSVSPARSRLSMSRPCAASSSPRRSPIDARPPSEYTIPQRSPSARWAASDCSSLVARPVEVAGLEGQAAELHEHPPDAPRVAGLAQAAQRLLERSPARDRSPGRPLDEARLGERERPHPGVACVTRGGACLVQVPQRGVVLAPAAGREAADAQREAHGVVVAVPADGRAGTATRTAPPRRGPTWTKAQRPTESCAAARPRREPARRASSPSSDARPSATRPRDLPVAPQRRGQAQADVGVAAVGGEADGRPQVVGVRVEAVEERALPPVAERPLRPPRQGPRRSRAWRAASSAASSPRCQPLERVLADGLEHPEARLVAGRPARPAGGSRRAATPTPSSTSVPAPRDRLGRVDGEAADEHAEAREQGLLVGAQQVVAPLDRRAQRAVAVRQVGRAALEEVEPAAEPGHDRPRREHDDPRGGELQRQRQAPEEDAELGDVAGVRLGQGELGRAARARATNSSTASIRVSAASPARGRQVERRDRVAPARRAIRSGARLVTTTWSPGAACEQLRAPAARRRRPARSCRAPAGASTRAGAR